MARSLLARKDVFSWCLYDWANSAFTTSIITAVLPVYFLTLTPRGAEEVTVRIGPFAYDTHGDALWSYITGAYELAAAIAAPVLGAMADYARRKKRYLALCVFAGSALTCALALVPPGGYMLCAALYIGAAFAWASGNLFYDALLPGLASDQREMDAISSMGYAIGYFGGGLLLAVHFLMVSEPSWFGFDDKAAATRAVFITVGLWWLVFSVPLFRRVREPDADILSRAPHSARRTPHSVVIAGFHRLFTTLAHVRRYRQAARLLAAFILYNTGIGTVITVAAVYGKSELGLSPESLMGCILMIQFLGFPAAFGFIGLARRLGAKRAILAGLGVYLVAIGYAYVMRHAWEFWLLGVLVALVQGGTQALSRSLFASMIPPGRSAEFFGFFSVFGKVGSFAGPLCFGIVKDATGSSRTAILFLAVFFALGGSLLATVNVAEGKAAAAGEPP